IIKLGHTNRTRDRRKILSLEAGFILTCTGAGVDFDSRHDCAAAHRHLGLDTRDTIVRTSDDRLIVTLGLKDLIVVHTPDATSVADKRDEESVRQLVQMLKDRGWE